MSDLEPLSSSASAGQLIALGITASTATERSISLRPATNSVFFTLFVINNRQHQLSSLELPNQTALLEGRIAGSDSRETVCIKALMLGAPDAKNSLYDPPI